MRISPTEAAPAQVQSGMKPAHRILVVDDDAVIRQFSSETLTRAGYYVHTAEDGAAGWEALEANHYDLLITDNNMPKLTGIELVRKLRAKNAILPVILASGTIPIEEMNRHPWLKFAATLRKPYTAEALLETVEEVLRAADEARSYAENYVPNATEAARQSTRRNR